MTTLKQNNINVIENDNAKIKVLGVGGGGSNGGKGGCDILIQVLVTGIGGPTTDTVYEEGSFNTVSISISVVGFSITYCKPLLKILSISSICNI